MTYRLKTPTIYDIYQDEYPVQFDPNALAYIMQASQQRRGSRVRWADAKVQEYVTSCKALGLKYGLYHFLSPNGIAEQAALFLGEWNKAGGATLAPIVDVEVDLNKYYPDGKGGSTIGNAVWQSHIKTFLDLVSAGTGRTPIIYTNRNYWSFAMTKQGVLQQLTPPSWTKDYPVWVAWYPDQPDNFNTLPASQLPAGWTEWAMWQWEDGGRSNGYSANDLNIPSDWYTAELGGVVIPPVDPPPIEVHKVHTIETFSDGHITVDGVPHA